MTIQYVPFIHKEQKRPQVEQLPLYIELVDPRYDPQFEKEESEEKVERGVVIIEL